MSPSIPLLSLISARLVRVGLCWKSCEGDEGDETQLIPFCFPCSKVPVFLPFEAGKGLLKDTRLSRVDVVIREEISSRRQQGGRDETTGHNRTSPAFTPCSRRRLSWSPKGLLSCLPSLLLQPHQPLLSSFRSLPLPSSLFNSSRTGSSTCYSSKLPHQPHTLHLPLSLSRS